MDRPTIVVVDSDDAVIQLMKELLDLEGYATCAFRTYDTDVAAIKQVQPDLIIIEASHRQPSTTLDLVDQIRHGRGNGTTTPIIVNSTSRQLLDTLDHSLMHLGCTLLEKPFDVEQFLHCVSCAMQTPLYKSEAVPHVTCT